MKRIELGSVYDGDFVKTNRKETKLVEIYSDSMLRIFKRNHPTIFPSSIIGKFKKIRNCHHVIMILNHDAVAMCLNVWSCHLAVIKWLSCVQGEMITLLPCSKLQV